MRDIRARARGAPVREFLFDAPFSSLDFYAKTSMAGARFEPPDLLASFPGFTRALVLRPIRNVGLSTSARVKPGNEAKS